MQECNVQPISTLTGSLVDQAQAFLVAHGKGFRYPILDLKGNMMDATASVVEKFLHSTLGTSGLKEFQLYFSHLQESGLYLLVFYYFCCITLQPQYVGEERQGLLNALDCNAQMLNVRNLHVSFLFNV